MGDMRQESQCQWQREYPTWEAEQRQLNPAHWKYADACRRLALSGDWKEYVRVRGDR